MTPSPKTPHLVAAVVASLALAVPAAAGAADSFVGVTDGTKLVQFHSDTLPGLSTPVAIGGLPAGEQVLALDRAPSGDVLAVSTAGTLSALDADRARVTRRVASLAGPIPAEAPTTLAVAADGATARVLPPGRDVVVDLAAGAVTRNDAAPSTAIAADLLPDGTLRGVDVASGHAV